MSAMAWLEFIVALSLAAVLWALVGGATNDLHDKGTAEASTTAGQTGMEWLGIWIEWIALWALLLAVFGFIVVVVVRQEAVFR